MILKVHNVCLDEDSVISASRSLRDSILVNTIHEKALRASQKQPLFCKAPEHFMYLGLKIWKLLGSVMVDCYLANCLICNNCSALHLQAGIEYSICEGFGLIKTLLRGLLCASRQV